MTNSPEFQEIRPLLMPEAIILDSETIASITDISDTTYGVYVFNEFSKLPLVVAEWLQFRSYDDEMNAANNADDKIRFHDPLVVQDEFLLDRGGRRLYIAVGDDGKLYGESWIHPIVGDLYDYHLYNRGNSFLVSKGRDLQDKCLATVATREYDSAHNKGLFMQLQTLALVDYFALNETVEGVVERITAAARNDSFTDLAQYSTDTYSMENVHTGDSYWVIMALRKEMQKSE